MYLLIVCIFNHGRDHFHYVLNLALKRLRNKLTEFERLFCLLCTNIQIKHYVTILFHP